MMRTPIAALILALVATPAQAQWSAPVNITRLPAGFTAYNPSLAIDSTGTLHASWSLRLSNEFDWIDYSTKPVDSDTWLTPVHVSRDSFPYRGSAIVIGPSGLPHVIWQSEGEGGHLYISRKSGDTWSTPERLTSWNRSGFAIRACADRQQRIHAVWGDLDLHTIWYACYDDLGWHGPEVAVADSGEMANPDVAADRDGYAHVVYQPPGSPVGCGYIHQTATGWGIPETIPALTRDAVRPRIALDTGDCPQVAWYENRQTVYVGWTGDAWTSPVRLDSVAGAYPGVCADSFGQMHVFYSDGPLGLIEATTRLGQVVEKAAVDPDSGWGELAATHDLLALLRISAYPHFQDIWYSQRALAPPGVSEDPGDARLHNFLASAATGGQLHLNLPSTTWVRMRVYDIAGRRLLEQRFDALGPGQHSVAVEGLPAAAGVYFCHVTTEVGAASVKIIRK